jgi:hypothetical protein
MNNNGPSKASLEEIPEVDFSKVKIIGRGLKKDRRVTLKTLRVALGKTQMEVARAADMSQGDISRFEDRVDMKVSTLTRYVAALGAEIDVVVRIGGRQYRLDV